MQVCKLAEEFVVIFLIHYTTSNEFIALQALINPAWKCIFKGFQARINKSIYEKTHPKYNILQRKQNISLVYKFCKQTTDIDLFGGKQKLRIVNKQYKL